MLPGILAPSERGKSIVKTHLGDNSRRRARRTTSPVVKEWVHRTPAGMVIPELLPRAYVMVNQHLAGFALSVEGKKNDPKAENNPSPKVW